MFLNLLPGVVLLGPVALTLYLGWSVLRIFKNAFAQWDIGDRRGAIAIWAVLVPISVILIGVAYITIQLWWLVFAGGGTLRTS